MPIDYKDITVVIQGPIYGVDEKTVDRPVTKDCIASVRASLPNATIILSTWTGSIVSDLDFDEVLFNDDPGSTIIKYGRNDQPHHVNTNRQIVSTVNGLKSVKTKYAIKLRTDNILYKNDFVELINQFTKTDPKYALTNNKVVVSNIFAKEFVRGLYAPFLFSDFFYFGTKEDLLKIWDIPFIKEYKFNSKLKGQRQHADYPRLQLHIEQHLILAFINKYRQVSLIDKYDIADNQKIISEKILASNFIVLEREELGLIVPKRLQQNDSFPFEYYTFARWQSLYIKYCDKNHRYKGYLKQNILYTVARLLQYVTVGWKQHLRSKVTR